MDFFGKLFRSTSDAPLPVVKEPALVPPVNTSAPAPVTPKQNGSVTPKHDDKPENGTNGNTPHGDEKENGTPVDPHIAQELKKTLDRLGVLKDLTSKGFIHLVMSCEARDISAHHMKVTDRTIGEVVTQENDDVLIDLSLRKKPITPTELISLQRNTRATITPFMNFTPQSLVIESLTLQDPLHEFKAQDHLGAAVVVEVFSLINAAASELNCDCIVDVPAHFHNAVIYGGKGFKFVDPGSQALFTSISNDLRTYIENFGLSAVSWAIQLGCLVRKSNGQAVDWKVTGQVLPVSTQMKQFLEGDPYLDKVREFSVSNEYDIDWNNPKLSHFLH